MDPKEFIRKGTFLATIYNGDDFRLSRLEESAFMYAGKYLSITWLKKTHNQYEYFLTAKDKIESKIILCTINVQALSRFKYKISKEIEEFVRNEIKFYNEVLPTLPTEEIQIESNSFNKNISSVFDDTTENIDLFDDSGSDYIPSPQQKKRRLTIRGKVLKKRGKSNYRESSSSCVSSSINDSSSFNEKKLASSTDTSFERSMGSITNPGPSPTETKKTSTEHNYDVNNKENINYFKQSSTKTNLIFFNNDQFYHKNVLSPSKTEYIEDNNVQSNHDNSLQSNYIQTEQNQNNNDQSNYDNVPMSIETKLNENNSSQSNNTETEQSQNNIDHSDYDNVPITTKIKLNENCLQSNYTETEQNQNNNDQSNYGNVPMSNKIKFNDINSLQSKNTETEQNSNNNNQSHSINVPMSIEIKLIDNSLQSNYTQTEQNQNNNDQSNCNNVPMSIETKLNENISLQSNNTDTEQSQNNIDHSDYDNVPMSTEIKLNENSLQFNYTETEQNQNNIDQSNYGNVPMSNKIRFNDISSLQSKKETETEQNHNNNNQSDSSNVPMSIEIKLIDNSLQSKYTQTEQNQNNNDQSNYDNIPMSIETKLYDNSLQSNNRKTEKKKKNNDIVPVPIELQKKHKQLKNKIVKKDYSKNCEINGINVLLAKKENGNRLYDKFHVCFICNRKCLKISRHLELKHAQHTEVAKVLAKEKNSKERREGFAALLRVGDFYHNMEVLCHKEGNLILSRRPAERESKNFSYFDFGPCPYCLGFMQKRMLWVHVKSCTKVKSTEERYKTVRLESESIINSILHNEEPSYVKNILGCLKNDKISEICKSDALIRGIGVTLYEKHCGTQNDLIRQTMRQCGRLLDTIRINNEPYQYKDLKFFIDPQHFDIIINAVRILCKSTTKDYEKTEYGIPTLALKISHSLRKGVGFLRGQSLRAGLIQEDQKLKSFLELMDMEWAAKISTHALSTITKNKMNTVKILPLTSDLMKLNKFLTSEIDIFKTLLQNNPAEIDAWYRLAEAVLARLILFNKRRSGEASRITLEQYSSSAPWQKTSSEELLSTLSEYEKQLANRLKLVQIMGKRGRIVPVLLTDEIVSGINILISTRITVGVEPNNKYVFARLNNSLVHIRGSDAIRSVIQKCELKEPKSITGTSLRKYVATVAQVFALKDNELDWLARHLGHDIRVHRDFYRLHESAIELTKISRLLMAVDEGVVSQFKGKTMDEINLNDLPDIEVDPNEDEELLNNPETKTNKTEASTSKVNEIDDDKIESDSSEDNKCNKPLKKKTRGKKKCTKVPWSTEEMQTVTSFFNSHIKRGVVPGKKECDACITKNTILARRKWPAIKYCVKNYISKKNKVCGNEK